MPLRSFQCFEHASLVDVLYLVLACPKWRLYIMQRGGARLGGGGGGGVGSVGSFLMTYLWYFVFTRMPGERYPK